MKIFEIFRSESLIHLIWWQLVWDIMESMELGLVLIVLVAVELTDEEDGSWFAWFDEYVIVDWRRDLDLALIP
jgi:hypothetical protein